MPKLIGAFALGVMAVLLGGPASAQNVVVYCGTAAGASLPASPANPCDVVNQARVARAITPADNTPLALGPTRGVYIGAAAACAIAVILADDAAAVTFSAVPAGSFMPIRAKTVQAAATTCTGIIGLW